MVSAVAIYILAGLSIAWFVPGNWWQRGLMIVAWPIGTAWSLLITFIEYWDVHGYQYEVDDE